MMEGVESKKNTTKFYNKVKFCIRAGSMTARNELIAYQRILSFQSQIVFGEPPITVLKKQR